MLIFLLNCLPCLLCSEEPDPLPPSSCLSGFNEDTWRGRVGGGAGGYRTNCSRAFLCHFTRARNCFRNTGKKVKNIKTCPMSKTFSAGYQLSKVVLVVLWKHLPGINSVCCTNLPRFLVFPFFLHFEVVFPPLWGPHITHMKLFGVSGAGWV